MIPKIIHYCWFGGNELPELAVKCIKSWKQFCPDFEIKRWDETSFDVYSIPYVAEAYNAKKYAFVSDYVRLYAIYQYGGIYMDTDVEVCQDLSRFLEEVAFSGFESYTRIPTGIMAGVKGNTIYKDLLDYYVGKHFILPNGELDLTTNVDIITDYFVGKGLQQNNTKQTICGYTFYPQIVFCPRKDDQIDENRERIYTIHHFVGSWLPEKEIKKRNSFLYKAKLKIIRTIRAIIISIIGKKTFEKLRGRENE